MVEFRVLGPLEVVGPSGPAGLGGRKARLVLALLVLHVDQVVPRSTIIDALWPEQPPRSAPQTVESYVSRLRAAFRAVGIAEPVIVAAPGGGYRLLRGSYRFDFEEFADIAAGASRAAERRETRRAADGARTALGLWRGPALAGLADEPSVQAEALALEDCRLQVRETLAEAELALGHHAGQIPELRAATARAPERERMHELLMLALYRAGRQAEALEVYRALYHHLDRELGLEPGPRARELEAGILRQDTSLSWSPSTGRTDAGAPPTGRRRRRGLAGRVAVAVAAALVGVLAILEVETGRSANLAGVLRKPAIGLYDIRTGRPRVAVALSVVAGHVTTGAGAQWATSYDNGTLMRIDTRASAVVQTVEVGHGAAGLAVGAGSVWIADSLDNQLARVNAVNTRVVQDIPVGQNPDGVAAGTGVIWVANRGDGTVSRINAATGDVIGITTVGADPSAVAVGAGAVWVALRGSSAVARLDEHTGRLVRTIRVGSGPSAIAVGGSGVWVANALDSTVALIDPRSNRVVSRRAISGTPTALAADGTGVWVATDQPVLTRLDASGPMFAVGTPSPATSLAKGEGGLLVAVRGTVADHHGGTLLVRTSLPIVAANPESCCDTPPNVRVLSYDGLLAYSKSPASPGALVPDLALGIPAATDGGTVYTFRLRPGLRYWNGTAVRASDFLRGFEHAAESSGVWADYLAALPGALACTQQPRCDLGRAVHTDDRDRTITLRLSHPDPELLLALGLPSFAPAPPGTGIRPGTGPYRIAGFVPGHTIRLERNPYFYEWSPVAQPAGYPNRIVIRSDGSPSIDIADVLAGRADYTPDPPTPSELRRISLRFPARLHAQPLPDTDFLVLNTHAAPFDDLRVRRALNLAVNRDEIATLYGGRADATPTCQIIPATIPGHVPYCPYTAAPTSRGRWTAPNLRRARTLIAASGTRGETVTVLTPDSAGPSDAPTGRYITRLLRSLGYRARIRVVPTSRYGAALTDYRRPPQIATNSWVADIPSPSNWITLFLSCGAWDPPTQLNNQSQLCSPALDRLAAHAARLQPADPTAANTLWAQVDRLATNLAPWIPTVTETETDLVSARAGNYQYVPTIGTLLDQLWIR